MKSGPPLGRPPQNVSSETKKQAQLDEKYRNVIEGKFGQGKRRFNLDRIMSKLSNTAETSIAITFLVMNLNTIVKKIIHLLFYLFLKNRLFLALLINKSYQKA